MLDACASMCMQICMLVPISNMHLHAFLLKVSKFRKHDSKYFCDCQKIFSWFWKHAVLQKVSKISYPDHLPLLLLLRLMQRYFIDFSADLLYHPLAAVRLQWHLPSWRYMKLSKYISAVSYYISSFSFTLVPKPTQRSCTDVVTAGLSSYAVENSSPKTIVKQVDEKSKNKE